MLVLDGIADRPIKELGYKTPLEVANKPNIDNLAARGINGILDIIAPGVRPGSDVAHLSILGYDPYKYYTGRGPLEALGVGIDIKENEIAFRTNFATVNENLIVLDRRAGRIDNGYIFDEAINRIKVDDVQIFYKTSLSHRGVLILRGKRLSDKVSDTDPHKIGVKVQEAKPLDSSMEAKRTADIINKFTKKVYEILNNHPENIKREKEGKPKANILLIRGAGKLKKVEAFESRYRMRGACVAKTAIIKGIGRLLNMHVEDSKQKIEDRIIQALNLLKEYDFVLLNIKEGDEAGHDGDYKKKIKIIETIDKAIENIFDFIESNYFVMLADHTTPCSVRDHTGDEVPIMIVGPEIRRDDVKKFSERDAYKGYIGRIRGLDLMNYLMNLTNRAEKYGA